LIKNTIRLVTFFGATWISIALLPAQADAPQALGDIAIPNLRLVSPGFYRGGRPKEGALLAMKNFGVKTDLDLENKTSKIAAEAAVARELGIQFISKPMSSWEAPSDDDVRQILAILSDRSRYPLLIHCKHGQDRTGLIVGLYRVFHDHWTPKAAHDEMLANGFHPELDPLEDYFEEKTGFKD